MTPQGFAKCAFEESIWIRPAGGIYRNSLILHAHIDDALIRGANLTEIEAFKASMLQRFDGTNEGTVTQHLGCEIIRDMEKRELVMRQKGYAKRILELYGFWDKPSVKTPMAPGVCLSKGDCPDVVNPDVHRWYWGII